MGYERLKQIKHNLMCAIEGQMCNLYDVDAEELGCAIDMLKDMEEAIYFSTITEAMEGKNNKYGDISVEIERSEKQQKSGQSQQPQGGGQEIMYYPDYARMYNMSYMPQQDRMYNMMYHEEYPMMYEDGMSRMYADNQGGRRVGRPSGSQNRGGSSRSYESENQGGSSRSYANGGGQGGSSGGGGQGSSSGGGQGGSSSSNYSEPMMYERDSREGRSPQNRKMYLEAKEKKHDKASQLRELEKYMQELSSDMVEMIEEASPEEKQYLEKKISALASKIGQMK